MAFSLSASAVVPVVPWAIPLQRTFYIPSGPGRPGYTSMLDAFATHADERKESDRFILSGVLALDGFIGINRQWELIGEPGATLQGTGALLIRNGSTIRGLTFDISGLFAITIQPSVISSTNMVPYGVALIQGCTFKSGSTNGIYVAVQDAPLPIIIDGCEFFLAPGASAPSVGVGNAALSVDSCTTLVVRGCTIHGNTVGSVGPTARDFGPSFLAVKYTGSFPKNRDIRLIGNSHVDGPLYSFVLAYEFPPGNPAAISVLPKSSLTITDNKWTDAAGNYNLLVYLYGPDPPVGPLFLFTAITMTGNSTPNNSGTGLLNLFATCPLEACGRCEVRARDNQIGVPRITATGWSTATDPDTGLIGYTSDQSGNYVDTVQYPPP